MNLVRHYTLGLILVTALAQPASADVITDWNRMAVAVMMAANTGGNPSARNMGMMHVAMSDAVNSVQNRFAIYAPAVRLCRVRRLNFPLLPGGGSALLPRDVATQQSLPVVGLLFISNPERSSYWTGPWNKDARAFDASFPRRAPPSMP